MSSQVMDKCEVLEVGAGDGRLTKEILKRASTVVAVEIDERFKPDLLKLNSSGNLKVIIDNVLDLDLESFMDPGFQIVSSLPYHISEPFLHKIITWDISNAVLLVGDGLIRGSGKLALLIDTFFKTELLSEVSKKSFSPVPRTDSVVLKLTPKKGGESSDLVIKELFLTAHRGGLLKNVLREKLIKLFDLTQKQSKEKVDSLGLESLILNKSFDQLNNHELESFCYNLRHHGDTK
ncbi:MAG: rRNA adenine N-6-methyltransferase family protein [Patescibacteria group bacterium]